MTNRNPITTTPPNRRFLPAWFTGPLAGVALVAIIYSLFYLAWLYFHWGGEENTTLIGDLINLPLEAMAILSAWWVATQRRLEPRLRRAWLILGLGLFSYFIGDLIWAYYELVLEIAPFPALYDVFYLAFYALIMVGLLTVPGGPLSQQERGRFLLDQAIVLVGAAMFVWYFIIQPTVAAYENDLLTQLVAAAYPIGDLMLIASFVSILYRRPERDTRAALGIALLGMVAFVITDLAYIYAALAESYTTGSWIDGGWIAIFLCFILAALRQLYTTPGSAPQPRSPVVVEELIKALPFVAIGLSYGLVLYAVQVVSEITTIVWVLTGAVLLTGLVIIRQIISPSFANLSLRGKLMLAFLGVAILSIGLVTMVVNQVIRGRLTDQVGADLQALTRSQASQIARLLDQQLDTLQTLVLNQSIQDRVTTAIYRYNRDPAAPSLEAQLQQLEKKWQGASDNDPLVKGVVQNPFIGDLLEFQENFPEHTFLLVTDRFGGVVAATQHPEHYNYAAEAWWQAAYNQGQGALYIEQPQINTPGGAPTVIIAVPVRGHSNQEVVGVLHSVYSLASLKEILASVQLGQTGHSDLLLPNSQIIAAEQSEFETPDSATLAQLKAAETQPYAQFMFEDVSSLVTLAPVAQLEGDTKGEAIHQLGWKLVAHQADEEALTPANNAVQIALLASLGALLLAGLLAFVIARSLVQPITRLTAVAEQIAGGDLTAQVSVESTDEIGTLALAFNRMTGQLRQTLLGLENRTRSLEIITDLSGQMVSILEFEQLITEMVNQIKNRFGYYHVQVYLTNKDNNSLVLAGSTGEAGKTMLAQHHTLPMGKGLVGRAAAQETVIFAPNLTPIIAPEVVTAKNIDAVYPRETNDAFRSQWYNNYITQTFTGLTELTAAANSTADRLKLGYILYDVGEFSKPILQGAQDAANALGLDIEIAALPHATQPGPLLEQFDEMLAAGKDGLIVVPQLQSVWPAYFNKALKANVPVVTANLTGPDIAPWVWFGQDGYQGGFSLAIEFKQFLQAAGLEAGEIVVGISGTREMELVARYEGFKAGLAGTDFSCSPLFNSNTIDPEEDYRAWTEFIEAQPHLIAAVGLTAVGIPTLARIKANSQAKWLIAGFDLEVATLEALRRGVAQVTVAQHPYLQGYLPVLALAQYLRQEKPLEDWVVKDWLPNPLLPQTKAEISIPIMLAGQVAGVLDIQSNTVGSLSQYDVTLLQSLANQVAIGLRNVQQFEQVQQALAQAQAIQEQYVEQAWDRNKMLGQNVGQVRFSMGESSTLTEEAVAQARKIAFSSAKSVTVSLDDEQELAYIAPIKIRNIPIGNLQLHGLPFKGELSNSDRALIEAIIDQVALAAESLRLINETRERAAREQLIGQIGDRLRSASNMEALMEIGVSELAKVLNPARTYVHFGNQAELVNIETETKAIDLKSQPDQPMMETDKA